MPKIIFFIKFFEKREYLNDFLQGKFFLNRLSYFMQVEEKNYSNRADPYEGALCWSQPHKVEFQLNGYTFNPNDFVEPILIQKNSNSNHNILSLYAGHTGEFKSITNDTLNDFKSHLLVDKKNISLGGYAAIVFNTKEFIERVSKAVIANNYPMKAGLVKYFDPQKHHGFFGENEVIFKKRSEFSYQQEYRFAVNTHTEGNNAITLEVGEIKDIASECNINDFTESIHIELNGLSM